MSSTVRHGFVAWVLVAVATVTACGGGRSGEEGVASVASVGGRRVTLTALAHWMKVLAPQHVVPRRASLYQALKRQALDFLISADWLLGEAADRGTPVTEREVERRLREREGAYPGGPPEFEESVRAIAHTLSDVKLEIADELASAKIRQRLSEREPKVIAAGIASYYNRHIAQFEHAEERAFHIFENIPSERAARTMIGEIAHGRRSIADGSLYEHWKRPGDMRAARTILKAIFTLRPDTISEPVKVDAYYFLVEVNEVKPAYRETLAQARDAIGATLSSERRRRTLARFIVAWRRRWTAKTSCSPGYVVQKCLQYEGAREREEPLSLT